MNFGHLRFAGEKRQVAAHPLVPHLDRKTNRAGVGDALGFGNSVAATALSSRPVTLLSFSGFAVVLHPGADAGHGEFDIKLAAAGDRAVDAKLSLRDPAPCFEVALVRTERKGTHIN